MIAQLIGGFIAIIVGASLLGPAADTIYSAHTVAAGCNGTPCDGVVNLTYWNATNVTGWAKTVTSLTTGFFALALMGVGVAVLYGVLKEAGVF